MCFKIVYYQQLKNQLLIEKKGTQKIIRVLIIIIVFSVFKFLYQQQKLQFYENKMIQRTFLGYSSMIIIVYKIVYQQQLIIFAVMKTKWYAEK